MRKKVSPKVKRVAQSEARFWGVRTGHSMFTRQKCERTVDWPRTMGIWTWWGPKPTHSFGIFFLTTSQSGAPKDGIKHCRGWRLMEAAGQTWRLSWRLTGLQWFVTDWLCAHLCQEVGALHFLSGTPFQRGQDKWPLRKFGVHSRSMNMKSVFYGTRQSPTRISGN